VVSEGRFLKTMSFEFRQLLIQPTNIVIYLQILILLTLAGCQSVDRKQQQFFPFTPEPTINISPTGASSVGSSELEPTVQSKSTQTPAPKTGPTSPIEESEITEGSATEFSEVERGELCGQLLPLTTLNNTPETTTLPAISFDETRIPPEVKAALLRLIEAPETVGVAAFEIGRESEGFYLNPDEPMPLASVVKIINLIAYAQAIEDGVFDPSSWVDLDDLEKVYLPRIDLGAHERAMDELEEKRLIAGDPPATPLEEIPGLMIRHSSNAAADFIHLAIGQHQLEETIIELGLESHTAPCPWIGQFLILANHERIGSNRSAVESYITNPARFAEDVMALTIKFVTDKEFRNEEIAWRRRQPSFDVWKLYAENLNAKGSPRDYARLLSQILSNEIATPYVNLIVRRALEWPIEIPENQDQFSIIGYKGGSLPGILTTAYYGQRQIDGRRIVVVLFFRDLPRNTYQAWLADHSHDELARWLLSDEDAIEYLRQLLGTD
jgi:D-alanyl-D-alanine carboxypeptidase